MTVAEILAKLKADHELVAGPVKTWYGLTLDYIAELLILVGPDLGPYEEELAAFLSVFTGALAPITDVGALVVLKGVVAILERWAEGRVG